jgi:negative regulator of flagellin synthesis FlgM
MANKINGMDSRPIGLSGGTPVTRVRDATTPATGSDSSDPTDVRITDGARRLATLEGLIAALPAVDAGRVTEVSRSIDQGTFRVDAERIAQRLLRQDAELADARGSVPNASDE